MRTASTSIQSTLALPVLCVHGDTSMGAGQSTAPAAYEVVTHTHTGCAHRHSAAAQPPPPADLSSSKATASQSPLGSVMLGMNDQLLPAPPAAAVGSNTSTEPSVSA